MNKDQALKRWGEALAEIHALLSGQAEASRPLYGILADLERVRGDPGARGLGLSRPCPWLAEWRAFDGQVPALEQERREWVDRGWVNPTPADDHRHAEALKTKAQAEAEERERQERLRREEHPSGAELIRSGNVGRFVANG